MSKKLKLGIREIHPYKPFLPKKVEKVVLGSFPPGKFTNPERRHEISHKDIDFYYGSDSNLFWRLIGDCFSVKLTNKFEILKLLRSKRIGLANIIYSCRRDGGRATDCDLHEIFFNFELEGMLLKRKVKIIYFTSVQVQRWYRTHIKKVGDIQEVLLFSPSTQGARAVGRDPEFKALKKLNSLDTYDFRLKQYRSHL